MSVRYFQHTQLTMSTCEQHYTSHTVDPVADGLEGYPVNLVTEKEAKIVLEFVRFLTPLSPEFQDEIWE